MRHFLKGAHSRWMHESATGHMQSWVSILQLVSMFEHAHVDGERGFQAAREGPESHADVGMPVLWLADEYQWLDDWMQRADSNPAPSERVFRFVPAVAIGRI